MCAVILVFAFSMSLMINKVEQVISRNGEATDEDTENEKLITGEQ
jgi:hypothetical protein